MKRHLSYLVIVGATLMGLIPLSLTQAQQEEQVYGWQLMTEQERAEHRAKMRSFKTEKEREQYRREHHMKMQERAKQQGVTLPDVPEPRGKGMGGGPRSGSGMGPGQGRGEGPGAGKGR